MKAFDIWKAQIPELVGSYEMMVDIFERRSKYQELSEIYECKLSSYYNNYLDFMNLNEVDIALNEWILEAEKLI